MQNRLKDLICRHRAIFKGFACIKGQEHKIKLKKGVSPICVPWRRRAPQEEQLEREFYDKALRLAVLEQSISPWAACNVFVPKEDSGTRVTTDFQALNNVTETDPFLMGDVHNTLDWLSRKKIFSTFDLKEDFFQVKLGDESKPLTAVRTVVELLQYTRLPQGLKKSPGTFQRVVNSILSHRRRSDALSYIDDKNIGTETEEQRITSLHEILTFSI